MDKATVHLGIVILHYLNLNDTCETIQSIKERLDTDKYHIVVVDNASPNGSGTELKEKYFSDDHVTVLLNEKNLGFSAGNNVGIEFLKKNYHVEFVVLSNNDIVLYDEHFYEKVQRAFQKTQFAVMGPLIMTADGRCDANPISDVPYTREDSLAEIAQYEKLVKLGQMGMYPVYARYDYYMRKLFSKYREKHSGVLQKDRSRGLYLKERQNIVLHGCFMVFSNVYFKTFRGLDERTFMFSEENILFQHLKQAGLKMLYYPEIAIYHKEGASVNKAYAEGVKAKLFRYEMKIKSHRAYIELIDEIDEGKNSYYYLGEKTQSRR